MFEKRHKEKKQINFRLAEGIKIGIAFIALAGWLGCDAGGVGSSQGIKELQKGQKKILERMDKLEKLVVASGKKSRKGPPIDYNKVHNIKIDNSPFRGPKDAKVVLVEYSDLQCPYSKKAKPLINDLLKAFPNDLMHVWKNFPLGFHKQAKAGAKACMAAGNQGKFWEMQELAFKNSKKLEDNDLKKYAKKIGLDLAQFEKDFEGEQLGKQIQNDMIEAKKIMVRGTPTLFINGKRVKTRTFDAMKKNIEDSLKKAK